MIVTLLAVLALSVAQSPAGASPTVTAPTPPAAPVSPTAVASPAAATAEDTPANLDGLQQVYDQSCAAREYGAYDDLCDQLSHQLRDARVEAAREAHRKAVEARRRPRAPAAAPPTAAKATPGP